MSAARLQCCKPGIRIINTARGELIDESALRRAIETGIVAGAALDVFEHEPPSDWSLAILPQVISTPHIAASTEEAQEAVGLETAMTVRDFLRDGVVRNAVNFPSIHTDELQRLQPWIRLAYQLGTMVSQMGEARIEAIGVRYYGALAESRGVEVLAIHVQDTAADTRAFVRKYKPTYPIALDPKLTIGNSFGFTGTPYTVVIDQKGEMVSQLHGEAAVAKLPRILDELLKKSPQPTPPPA